jgi:hypothetical protein
MMPFALRAEIVLGCDDLLVEQDKTILIDHIGDGRQYQERNQEDQDRSPECFHAFGRPLRGLSWHEIRPAVNMDLPSGGPQVRSNGMMA